MHLFMIFSLLGVIKGNGPLLMGGHKGVMGLIEGLLRRIMNDHMSGLIVGPCKYLVINKKINGVDPIRGKLTQTFFVQLRL